MQNANSSRSCPACTPSQRTPCPDCGLAHGLPEPDRALRLAAVEGLLHDIDRRPHLPQRLRAELLTRTQAARTRLQRLAPPAPVPIVVATPLAEPAPFGATSAKPIARRVGPAVAAVVPEPPPPDPVVPPPEPTPVLPEWLRRLAPAAAENLLYLLGGFLVVAGAIYFASTAWTTMSGLNRLLLLDGGLVGLGGMLIGFGHLLTRRFAELPAGKRIRRITGHLAAGLLPIGAIIAGRAAMTAPLSGILAFLVVGAAAFAARRLADGERRARAQIATFMVVFAAAAVPWLATNPLLAALIAGAIAGAATFALPRPTTGSDFAHIAGATAGLVLHVVLVTGHPGAGTVTIAAVALGCVGRVRGRVGLLALLALSLLAIGPAFTAPRLLPLVCGLAAISAARICLRLGSTPMLPIALLASLVAYVTTPAPMAELVAMLRDAFAESMGYQNEPVPLAWYGLTCLPYVVGIMVAARWLDRTGRLGMARLTEGWLLLVMVSLCGLAVVSSDMRAPMAVLAVHGVTLVVMGLVLRRSIFMALGPLAVVGATIAGGLWLESSPTEMLLIAEFALAVLVAGALPFARRRGGVSMLAWSAAIPLVGAGFALAFLASEPASVPALGVLVALVGWRGWRTGDPLATALSALFAFGAIRWFIPGTGAGGEWVGPLCAALAVGAAELFRSLRPRPRRRPSMPTLTLPLALTGVVALWMIELSADPLHPANLAAFAAIWAHAMVRFHMRWAAPLTTWALAATAAATTGLVFADWAAPAAAMVGLVIMGLARLNRPRIRRLRSGLAMAAGTTAFAACLPGLISASEGLAAMPALAAIVLAFTTVAIAPQTTFTRGFHRLAMVLPGAAAVVTWWAFGADWHEVPVLILGPLAYVAIDVAARRGWTVPRHGATLAPALATFTSPFVTGAILVAFLVDTNMVADAALAVGVIIMGLRVVLPRHPKATTATLWLIAFVLGAALTQSGPWSLPLDWRALFWPAFALGMTALGPRAGLHRMTTRVLAGTVAAGLGAALLPWAMASIVDPMGGFSLGVSGLPLTLLLVGWATLSIWISPASLRSFVGVFVAIPLACRFPAISGLFGVAVPAIELAIVAALSARWTPRFALMPAALALICTGGAVREPLFALTLTVLATYPAIAASRSSSGRAGVIERTLVCAFVAASAWLIALVPSSGNSPLEILPPLATVAALFTLITMGVNRVAGRMSAALGDQIAGAMGRLRWGFAGLGLAFIGANTILRWGVVAPSAGVMCGCLALLVSMMVTARATQRTQKPAGVDAIIFMLALSHAFLAGRTGWLAPLDGHHLLLWAAAAPLVRWFGDVTPLTVRLSRRALIMPIPALLATAPDHATSAIALLLAAVTWGLAARQTRRPTFTATGLTLTLAAGARMLMAMDVVDPAFYGLPAGLALVVGAWIERRSLTPRTVEILQLIGVAIADLSVAAQVIRVEEPVHAALLFALGLGTVAVGWVRRRGDLLILGSVAVVVDVTLHLLRTGFARGFIAAALLVGAGAVVLIVAGHHTRRRTAGS